MIGDAKLAAGGAALPNGKERNKNNVDIESPCRLKENKVPNFGERRHLIFSSLSLSFFLTCSSPLVRLKWSLPLTWVRAPFSFASRSQHATAVYSDQIFVLLRTFSLSRQLLYGFFFFSFCSNRRERKEPCPCTQRFLDVYGYMEALGPASPSVVIFLRRLKGFWGSSFVHRVLCGLFLLCL